MNGIRRCGAGVAIVLASAGVGTVLAQDAQREPSDYRSASGAVYQGVRPTSVGLPQLGQHGTIGATDLPTVIRGYHDSGRYDRDLAAVGGAALAYLNERLAATPAKTCTRRYTRVKRATGRPALYRVKRTCTTPALPGGKPAIVLDIDETSLSNYSGLVATNFSALGTALPAAAGTGTAIAPTVALYKQAKAKGVAVFFITGRPALIASATQKNLKAAGYDQGWDGLVFKPSGVETEAYKAGERAKLEQRGFHIVLNLGDQESDLDGGHAERGFKYANPFYFISD